MLQRPQAQAGMVEGRDHDWAATVAAAKAAGRREAAVEMKATDPLYILYTSGTTGVPKGVVRDIGGYLVALRWSMENIYGVKPGETFWTASDIGWVVGHSYIVYGPLIYGATAVLYEGKPVGTPDAGAFWRVICGIQGRRLLHRADRAAGRAQGGPGGEASAATTIFRACARCSWPASAPTPTPSPGRRRSPASRSSIIGGRPRPAGRSPPTRSASA